MTTLRRIFTAATLVVAATGFASADTIIGYTTSTGPTSTDITNFLAQLPSWDPGGTNTTLSNISGGSYTTGISMASLDAAGTIYVLEGYNITVQSVLTGTFTITNSSTNSATTGNVHIDSYNAVALGSNLAPPLTNTADPANDLFSYANIGDTSAPPSGEQGTASIGAGPDPASATFNVGTIAANGGTYTSTSINSSSKYVDLGCELANNDFCNETNVYSAANNLITSNLALVTSALPNLNFYLSSVTETDSSLVNGNNSTTYNTFINDTVTVTYDYITLSSTPEPATMALLGGALIGLGLIGKKRFTKN